jgi:hypothetical protein
MVRTSSFVRFACSAVALPLAIPLFAAAGCHSTDSNPSDGIALQDYEHKYGIAECAFAAKCGLMPDTATCKRVVAPDPNVAQAVASVVFGTLGYDPVAAQACVTALTASTCDSGVGTALPKTVTDACTKVFTGLHADGGPCFVGAECTSGKCKPAAMCADSCCLGTCDELGDAIAQDMPCGATVPGKTCILGTYCDTMLMKCTALKQANDPCTQADACVSGQRCDVGGTGVCFQAAASGAKCNPALKVDPCSAFNEFCDMTAASCVKLPGPGQPCTPANTCQADSYCEAMMCKLFPVETEACGATPCLGSLKCTGDAMKMGTCLPFDGTSTCVAPQ